MIWPVVTRFRSFVAAAAVLLLLFAPESGVAAGSKAAAQTGRAEPHIYQDIVSYLKQTGLRATEVQKRCTIFFEGEWKNADIYNYALIIVENSDEDVQVTFYLTDAHEMNWITEFLDAPLFTKVETRELFALLNAHESKKTSRVGRFQVEFHHWQPKHAHLFVFSFTPSHE